MYLILKFCPELVKFQSFQLKLKDQHFSTIMSLFQDLLQNLLPILVKFPILQMKSEENHLKWEI